MILTLALRSLLSRPIRSAVLAGGFGLGVSVMAALLGIGGVILEQARTPALVGGGDVIIGNSIGRIGSAKFVLSNLQSNGSLGDRVTVVSPGSRARLYLIDDRGATAVVARGGIPSLERGLADPETSGVESWVDTPADREWLSPRREDILRAMDRFHPIPDVPARVSSWSEWLYFNGRAGATRFYLTFLAGPRLASGERTLNVRLQLERAGRLTSYSHSSFVTDEQLGSAPDISAGPNRVRLVGSEYRIRIDLAAESGGPRASGEIVMRAAPGRSLPPFTMRGAGGWVSGYVVPVMSGELAGTIAVGRETIDLAGGTGYHDHNWGFWEGVRWQWGQVEGEGLAFVYGRVHPPADAADATRLPGFLVALGSEGPVGYATDVTIEQTNTSLGADPGRIVVRGRGDSLALTLDFAVEQITTTRMGPRSFGSGMNFLQLRGTYRASGRAGDRKIEFTAAGSAETFRLGPGQE
ncbi:MAG: hypothetical protein ACRD15_22590 [Vicinamibacterales bacterium]